MPPTDPHRPAGPRLRPSRCTALAVVVTVLLAAVAVLPRGAAADAVRPGDMRSVIDSVDPPTDAVEVEVLGGDAFLEVRAESGTEVVVLGYGEEPYLRIRRDGTVERNEASPAVALNTDRFGGESPDDESDDSPSDDPRWVPTGDVGRVAWHDHRIHWMAPEVEVIPGDDGVVQHFEVPLLVDGEPVAVTGRLLVEPAPTPWAIALAVALAVGGSAALLRVPAGRRRSITAAAVVGASAALATFAAVATFGANPPEADAAPWPVLLTGAALVAAIVSLVAALRDREQPAQVALLGSTALLAGWVVWDLAVLWAPVVPSLLPTGAARAVVAVAAAAVLVVVTVTAWPDRRPPGRP